MKTIFGPDGSNVTSTVVSILQSNQTLFVADLYQITLVSGWQSRNQVGNVARWTDKDYPITSTYLNSQPSPIGALGTSQVFYPQRMTRGAIAFKLGFEVSTLDVTVFTNDAQVTDQTVLGPVTVPLSTDLSIPSYRDAFAVLVADNLTVPETLKAAAWRGELDQAYFYMFRAFFRDDPRNLAAAGQSTEPLGVMPYFTGYIKQSVADRLQVKFTVGSLIDIFTTTQTPTQLIQPGDRGGATFIPIATIPQVAATVQTGSTPVMLISGDTPPTAGNTNVFDELHIIPPTGPFTITVNHAATFVSNIRVRNTSTGNIFGLVGGSPSEGHYSVNLSTGVYTFNSADANLEVSISYTYSNTGFVDFTNGWLEYSYGAQFNRPADTPVIRQVYATSSSGGHFAYFIFEPLPIAPTPGDTFIVYQLQPLDGTFPGAVPGFEFVPPPENAL